MGGREFIGLPEAQIHLRLSFICENADEYICIVMEMSTQRLSDIRTPNDTKRLSDMKATW